MRILITNDDGINAIGIRKLVEVATKFGEVWVVAPASQCSAMSMRLTILAEMKLEEVDLGIPGVTKAYSLAGTPADCVKAAIAYLMPEKPDIVFSGINFGFNAGHDIAYSGTVGAAFESLLHGIPAIAFSNDFSEDFRWVDMYIEEITRKLLANPPAHNEIYNVNFPGSECAPEDFKGIFEDAAISQRDLYVDQYVKQVKENGDVVLVECGEKADVDLMVPGTDMYAVTHGYISIGKVRCSVLV